MSVKICSIGDIMLGENVHHYRRGLATRYSNNYNHLIPPYLTEIVNTADILVGNFECTLMPDHERKAAPLSRAVYTAQESALNCFEKWKPTVVFNVANNHFGQHGEDAMAYTIGCLAKRNIFCIGQSPAPLTITVNEYQVSLWGITLIRDNFNKNGYLKSTANNLLSDIKWGVKPDDAFWVISIHWGDEYLTLPSSSVEKLAGDLADKGVDLIIGHHPHVVQPVRNVKGIPVAYSLGNFLFDQNFSQLTQTGLMMLSDLVAKKIHLYSLVTKKYRIVSTTPISVEKLEDYCIKNMSIRNPLLMRVLMKLELLAHAYSVPLEVWLFFLSQFIKKCLRQRGK